MARTGTWISPVSTDKTLQAGVTLTHWNGSPIELAVARNADREAGSNLEARRARGVEALTLRWFGMDLPPDEDWVTVTYTDGTKTFESRFDWEVIDSSDQPALLAGLLNDAEAAETTKGRGLDLKTTLLQRARKALFDPPAIEAEEEMAKTRKATSGLPLGAASDALAANQSRYPEVFTRFGKVKTPSGEFGYVRLATFAPSTPDINGVVAEFVRILETLPPSGLILDVHGNGGGYIAIGERILQTLSPGRMAPRNPFPALPQGAEMRVAARRSTRLGKRSGVPLEDLGVMRDERYFMTRNDVLNHNEDLIAHAAGILEGKERQTLRLTAVGEPAAQRFQIDSSNLDRVDLLVEDRPVLSLDVAGGPLVVTLPHPLQAASTLSAKGYREGQLVVSARYRA
jgi:hypothetical protein